MEGEEGLADVPLTDPVAAAQCCVRMALTHAVFFAMAVFIPGTTRRLADNVVGSRELRLDIDVGTEPGKYRTLQEATAALIRFSKAFLPPTMVLLSGGGLHVYWLVPTLMPKDVWCDLAGRLDGATMALGLLTDRDASAGPAGSAAHHDVQLQGARAATGHAAASWSGLHGRAADAGAAEV